MESVALEFQDDLWKQRGALRLLDIIHLTSLRLLGLSRFIPGGSQPQKKEILSHTFSQCPETSQLASQPVYRAEETQVAI